MDMASTGIFIFTLIITAGNAGFVNVQCKTEKVGQYGQQSLLECTVEASQEATDVVIRTVSWKKEGVDEPLLIFHGGEIIKQPGYSFAEPSWNNSNMNVSLHITNTAVGHQGVYTCSVMTDRGATTSKTSLKVTGGDPEKPSVQVTTIVARLVVIGSLIVGLLVVVILYKRRSRRDHQEVRAFESDAEEGGSREVDEEYQDTLA